MPPRLNDYGINVLFPQCLYCFQPVLSLDKDISILSQANLNWRFLAIFEDVFRQFVHTHWVQKFPRLAWYIDFIRTTMKNIINGVGGEPPLMAGLSEIRHKGMQKKKNALKTRNGMASTGQKLERPN